MLIEFCERNGLTTNTWLKKPKRRMYTWKLPIHQSLHLIEYVRVKQRFKNSTNDMETMAEADIDSDQYLLVAKFCTRLWKITKKKRKWLRWSRGCVLASSTQVRGFKPGRSRRIFQGEKSPSTPSFGGEVKPALPCRRFTACKRSLNVTWKSAFRQNSRLLFLAH
jgi:hypothetical protein